MRIGLVTDGIYPYVIGGMQRHSYYMAKYLSRHGVRVDLYHFKERNTGVSKEEIFGEDAGNIELITLEFPPAGKLPLHYLRESKQYSRKIFEAFKKRTMPDLVICKGFTGWEFVKRKKKGEKLPPICVNFHGYEMFQHAFTFKDKLVQYFLRGPVRNISFNADFVFSYGGKITDILKNELHIPANRIKEIATGIESRMLVAETKIPGNELRFVFVGRFEARKGVSELNQALKLVEQDEKWSFDFIGNIPGAERIIAKNIRYHGMVDGESNILEILRACDVLVCPSWSEGMPNVILEGMASGLAVFATDTGATSLLVNEQTGWLIDKPYPLLIAETLKKILNSGTQLVFHKKKAALEHVSKKFNWDKTGKDIYLCVKEIAASNHR